MISAQREVTLSVAIAVVNLILAAMQTQIC